MVAVGSISNRSTHSLGTLWPSIFAGVKSHSFAASSVRSAKYWLGPGASNAASVTRPDSSTWTFTLTPDFSANRVARLLRSVRQKLLHDFSAHQAAARGRCCRRLRGRFGLGPSRGCGSRSRGACSNAFLRTGRFHGMFRGLRCGWRRNSWRRLGDGRDCFSERRLLIRALAAPLRGLPAGILG